jgi:hypothetical protein
VRGDPPALAERVPQHRRGRLAAAVVDRGAAGEGVDHAQHAGLADRQVHPVGPLQGAGQQVRAGVRRADDEYRLLHLAAVDDENVAC